jgi:MGT family glycosyltransferase
VQAIADLDVRALVTVGARGDPSMFGPLPPKVRVEQFVPQARVMPHASLVVSHGGSGTLFGALAHGLPQLCLPQAADQFDNAELILRHGAGLFVKPDETTVGAVQNAVRRLLVEPMFREAAGGIQRAIEDMPAATEVVATIERFVQGAGR